MDDLNPATGSSEGSGSDLRPGRTEKPLALSVRDRAADHDSGWVECIDKPDAGNSECASTALHDGPARLIAGVLALGDVTCFDGKYALLGRPGRQEGALAISDGPASGPGHRRPADEGLEAANGSAAALAVHRDRRVAQLSGCAIWAVQDAPLDDDGSADPGRYRQIDEVLTGASGAEGHLAKCRDVGIAIEENRQVESGAKFCGHRHVIEPRTHVGRLQDNSPPRIHGTGAGDADADEPGPDVRRHVLAGPDESGLAGVENGPRAIGDRRADLGQSQSGSVIQHHGGANMRAPDVECEDWSCKQRKTLKLGCGEDSTILAKGILASAGRSARSARL